MGVWAQCRAIGTPYSCAMSPIFLVSRMPPDVSEVGVNDIYGVVLAEHFERLLQVDVFAGEDGDVDGVGDLLEESVSCQGIISSSQERLYLVERLAQADAADSRRGPKWSAAIGMSMPTSSRTAAT